MKELRKRMFNIKLRLAYGNLGATEKEELQKELAFIKSKMAKHIMLEETFKEENKLAERGMLK